MQVGGAPAWGLIPRGFSSCGRCCRRPANCRQGWGSKMLRWLESRIDPFKRPATPHPPQPLWAFYWHFVEPVLPWFLVVLVLDLLTALTEVALAKFVADLIDLLKAIGNPASLFADHAGLLLWMACVVLIARPVLFVGYELTKSQVLSPQFQTRVRWQAHRHMLRQSLGFFQNDFAGRVANKLMQTGSAMRDSIMQLSDAAVYVAVQWLSALATVLGGEPPPHGPAAHLACGVCGDRRLAGAPHPRALH